MKSVLKILSAALILAVGCSEKNDSPREPWEEGPGAGGGLELVPPPVAKVEDYNGELAEDRANAGDTEENEDLYWEVNTFDNKVTVTYNGSEAEAESTSGKILIYKEGAHVTVDMLTNSVKNVEIVLSGSTSDGSLKIYGEKKFMLTLNGVEISSQRGPAINNQCKKRMFVHLAEGSFNRLADCETYSDDCYYPSGVTAADEDRKGTLFSESHLIFSGAGVLSVVGRQRHAIATDNAFYMRPGVTLVIEDAAKNGIHVKGDSSDGSGISVMGGLVYAKVTSEAGKCMKTDESVIISGGQLLLKPTGEAAYDSDALDISSPAGIKADGDIEIAGGSVTVECTGSGGKGLNADGSVCFSGGATAISSTGGEFKYSNGMTSAPKGVKAGGITVGGGSVNISVTGASEGSEGMESNSELTVDDGEIYICSYDDAINAETGITVNGGRLFAWSLNNDALDSNGFMHITGGLVIANAGSGAEESFDCHNSDEFLVDGGVLIGTAGGGKDKPSQSSQQRVVMYGGLSSGKNENLAVLDSSGNPIALYTVPRAMDDMVLFFSSPDLKADESYTINTKGTVSDYTESWYGWCFDGKWSGGSQVGSFTSDSVVTTVNTGGSGGH
ncbi:MAG: carbohydrate-binding domain-containing protein [Alistipes sp.]|nr:carbohydrate-binding domain-containing protein [Alistipes sp.]